MRSFYVLFTTFFLILSCGSGDLDMPLEEVNVVIESEDFLSECDIANDECGEELFCFNFNAKGAFCTHACDTPDECGAPSTGCSGMGVCKAP